METQIQQTVEEKAKTNTLDKWYYRIALTILLLGVAVGLTVAFSVLKLSNDQIMTNTESLHQLQTIINNQQRTIDELKNDNKRQTELIVCLLVIHGEETLVSDEARANCQVRVANSQTQAAADTNVILMPVQPAGPNSSGSSTNPAQAPALQPTPAPTAAPSPKPTPLPTPPPCLIGLLGLCLLR